MRSPPAVRPQIVQRICDRSRGPNSEAEAASSAFPGRRRQPERLVAFGNSGSLENECDEQARHRAEPFGGHRKHRRCSVGAQRPNARPDLIERLHKNRPRQGAEGADDIALEPTMSRPPNPHTMKAELRCRRRPPSSTLSAGPAAALRMLTWEPADRCDATRDSLYADRVDAAEATSFCAWFCASSSSQSSSPRTSSSIWLFSPYCPPSHKRWRFRNSAVANRHALHSDYYSTMRKTATPLNEWWIAERSPSSSCRPSPRAPPATIRPVDARATRARKFRRSTKSPVAQGFSACGPVRIACARTVTHRSAATSR